LTLSLCLPAARLRRGGARAGRATARRAGRGEQRRRGQGQTGYGTRR